MVDYSSKMKVLALPAANRARAWASVRVPRWTTVVHVVQIATSVVRPLKVNHLCKNKPFSTQFTIEYLVFFLTYLDTIE